MTSQVVLITGALAGIGRATAFAFARDHASLVVSGRNKDTGQALAAELRDLGTQAEFIQADVRHEDEVRALVDQTVTRFGRLDVAVNNAGTEGRIGPLVEQTIENYTATFDTNVLGVLLSLKHQLRIMLPQGHGNIVNVSSVAGSVGFPGAAVYVASKHAVEGLTRSAALEAAKSGVRVNAIAPGPIVTAMLDRFTGGSEAGKSFMTSLVPAGRLGNVEEVAQAILFLASDKAPFITGQSLAIDGGTLAG
ncbi:glucose 1-dehydrogenase [Lichenicoccus sp.]|uniref:glucose 1-dehydrogenase n=1 Tax=Lichenicoccus sp. TaxID=2781899 RepID=UPI003D144C9F